MTAPNMHYTFGSAGQQGQLAHQGNMNKTLVHQVPGRQILDHGLRNDGLDDRYMVTRANGSTPRQYNEEAGNIYQTGLALAPGQVMMRGHSDDGPRMRRQDSSMSMSMSSGSAWTSPSRRAKRYFNEFNRRPKREVFDTREDDQCLTETQARDRLSSYVVIRMERANVDHDVDRDGNQRLPTWEKADQVILTDVSQKDAHRKVRELDLFTAPITDKRRDLAAPINHQLDHALNKLEEQEIDSRYCYELVQLDQKRKKMPVSPGPPEMYYVELPHKKSKESKKSKKKRSKKEKTYLIETHAHKPRRRKETVSLTAYFRRTPKADENCLKMHREAANSRDQDALFEEPDRLQRPVHLLANTGRRSPSSSERVLRQQMQFAPVVHQNFDQMERPGQSMNLAQQPAVGQQFLQHQQQQRQVHNAQVQQQQQQHLNPAYPYQVQQSPGLQQPVSAMPAGRADLRAQNMHVLQQQQRLQQQQMLQDQQRLRPVGQQLQQPGMGQAAGRVPPNVQAARSNQTPRAVNINQQRGPNHSLPRQAHTQAQQRQPAARAAHSAQERGDGERRQSETQRVGGRRRGDRSPLPKERGTARARSTSPSDSESSESESESDTESGSSVSSVESRRGRGRDRQRGHERKSSRSRSRCKSRSKSRSGHRGRQRHSRDKGRRSRSCSTSSSSTSRTRSTPSRVHRRSTSRQRVHEIPVPPIRVGPRPEQTRKPHVRYVAPGVEQMRSQFGRVDLNTSAHPPRGGIRFRERGTSGNGPQVLRGSARPPTSAMHPNHPFAQRQFAQRQQGSGY